MPVLLLPDAVHLHQLKYEENAQQYCSKMQWSYVDTYSRMGVGLRSTIKTNVEENCG